jgi:hypothetical protein
MLSLLRCAGNACSRQLVSTRANVQARSLRISAALRYDQDVESASIFAKSKKYFVDVKQGNSGKYLKISELSKERGLLSIFSKFLWSRSRNVMRLQRFRPRHWCSI